jgi:hypothetical protein
MGVLFACDNLRNKNWCVGHTDHGMLKVFQPGFSDNPLDVIFRRNEYNLFQRKCSLILGQF